MRSLTDRVTDRLHWLFLLLAGGFGLALVFMTPPNGGSDEISHEVKIVRVASGLLAAGCVRMPGWFRIVGVALIGLPCVALTYTLALIRWRYFGS